MNLSDSNPARILSALDTHLSSSLRLYIYGRSAIALGFPRVPENIQATMDVDAILPASEVGAIETNDDFWAAQEKVNRELGEIGLYFTHLFEDRQVILTPDWQAKAVLINALELNNLEIWRPSTSDLILTKMMRVDPDDRSDIHFLLNQSDLIEEDMKSALANAQIPHVPEINDAFEANKRWLNEIWHQHFSK